MTEKEILKVLDQNKEEYRKIFQKEWNFLSEERERSEGVEYRERYLDSLDSEIDQLLAAKERTELRNKKGSIKEAIEYGVWKVVCEFKDKDKKEGVPKKAVEDFFNSGELGATIIDQLILTVFTAIGSVWGGFAAAITTTIGKAVVKWINGLIAAKCDEIVEKKAKAFCKVPIQKPV